MAKIEFGTWREVRPHFWAGLLLAVVIGVARWIATHVQVIWTW